MPRVVFESADGSFIERDEPEGGRLIDLCDDVRASIPLSCRSANCGVCRIDVLEGGEMLAAPGDDELVVLAQFGDDPARRRLACQARVSPGGGRLRVRPISR
jgi:ferredoxin